MVTGYIFYRFLVTSLLSVLTLDCFIYEHCLHINCFNKLQSGLHVLKVVANKWSNVFEFPLITP